MSFNFDSLANKVLIALGIGMVAFLILFFVVWNKKPDNHDIKIPKSVGKIIDKKLGNPTAPSEGLSEEYCPHCAQCPYAGAVGGYY